MLRGRPDVSAGCAPELRRAAAQTWFNTWVGTYNPVYYYLVGWPSLLFEGNTGVYAMRIASSLLGCGAARLGIPRRGIR